MCRFAAALINRKLDFWVMNVVPVTQPNTLPVIYDRGLLGVAHDWYASVYSMPGENLTLELLFLKCVALHYGMFEVALYFPHCIFFLNRLNEFLGMSEVAWFDVSQHVYNGSHCRDSCLFFKHHISF